MPLRAILLLSALVLLAAAPVRAGLVINEIDYDQPLTDTLEFIEIANNGTVAESLDGVSLVLINGVSGGALEYDRLALSGTLAPGAYLVICGSNGAVAGCGAMLSLPENIIQNGAPDAVALVGAGDVLIDAVSYEGAVPGFTEGVTGAPADPGDGVNVSIGRFPNGNDSDDNAADFTLQCSSPGADNPGHALDCANFVADGPAAWGTLKAMYRR